MLPVMNAEPEMASYSREQAGPKIEISGPWVERSEEVLTPLSMQLLASLHRRFNPRRLELLAARGFIYEIVPPRARRVEKRRHGTAN